MNDVEAAVGGVLSDQAIADLVQAGELIVGPLEVDSLKPASYDLKIARDGAMMGDVKIPPGSEELLPARVVLQPGQAAMFSTRAMFRMPAHVAGNITIKNEVATQGLMLLSGLLIDPGYGSDEPVDGVYGCRLYLHVANIGRDPISINPDRDAIARVQFLHVHGGEHALRQKVKASRWRDQTQPSLGFLTELKMLKDKVDSTSNQVQSVVMLGYVVLGVTLIGVVVATVLAIVSK